MSRSPTCTLPILDVKDRITQIKCLLDTGANRNAISERCLKQLGLQSYQIQKTKVGLANGTATELSRAIQLRLPTQNRPSRLECLVLPMSQNIILGTPWMHANFIGLTQCKPSPQQITTILDIGSGIGTTLLGLNRSDLPLIEYYSVEINPECRTIIKAIYTHLWKTQPGRWHLHPNEICRFGHDAHKIATLPKQHFHHLIAGVPCQGFSRANPNALGLQDYRQLFTCMAKIMNHHTVDNYLLECTPFHANLTQDLQTINKWFGPPQMVDFSAVTAQRRQRLTWTSKYLDLDNCTPGHLKWQDCLQSGTAPRNKCPTIMKSINSSWNHNHRLVTTETGTQRKMNQNEALAVMGWTG